MSGRLSRLFGTTPAQRRLRYGVLLAAVVAVPLAVAGLVSGAVAGGNDQLEQIPAIVVNDDEMVTTTDADGAEQQVLAGRLLVTELTGGEASGFDWTISNDEEAAKKLADGEAYAVLTIPSDFSASVTSLSGSNPTKANLEIRTDDAHSYLAGSVVQSVGDAMTAAFGRTLTQQYLEGLYAGLADFGGSLDQAADGASSLASGAGSLSTGVGQLSTGVASAASGASDAASGASQYADGVRQYTEGVDGLASGLAQASAGSAGLDTLAGGVSSYVGGVNAAVGQIGGAFTGVIAQLEQAKVDNPELAPQLDALIAQLQAQAGALQPQLDQFTAQGAQLAAGVQSGVDQTQAGLAELSNGAAQLSGGSAAIRDGASSLASGVGELAGGLDQLSSGASSAATGADELASGAEQFASGLADGAEQAGALTNVDGKEMADVVSQPVTVDAARDHEIASTGEAVGMWFAPIGLWVGALAMFLVFRPFGREALRSTASTGGLVWRALARAGLVALGQTVAVVGLLHLALGVSWSLLPQTLAFSALTALAFTAVHAWLMTWLGRGGMIISLILVALQLTTTGLVPIEALSGPYQTISPFLPLTWAVQGMQLIVSGAGGAGVAGAAGVLALFALIGVLGTAIVVGRRRGIRSIGFASAALG
ncbi:YhgE/Pip family protein [Agromyces soli]|uniref:YhgE/Pip family protein n=1 Tax=Agromyces soli TaxID=659012 RepID=A0ABY4AQ16_9MICO|nr:YhgE/Pip family protein [Agromyces soli]UOE25085.1 YhgE/Pip family protein [Agromyces soli]